MRRFTPRINSFESVINVYVNQIYISSKIISQINYLVGYASKLKRLKFREGA